MGWWRSLGVDIAIVLAWAGLIYLLRDMSSQVELLAFVWGTLLVGMLSGRYRIAVAPLLPFIAIAFAAIADQGSCGASTRCGDDLPLGVALLFLAVLAVLAACVMAVGVLLRRWWETLDTRSSVVPPERG